MRKTGIICGTIALLFCCSLCVVARQLTPEEEMFKAVHSCDFAKVKALIAQNTYLLQIKDRDGRALLHLTARCKDVSVARFLIERKADVNAPDPNGWTPLHYAASANNLSLIKLLISNNAQVNLTDNSGLTPLFVGNAETAQFLLDNGADLYVEDAEGQTILHKRPAKPLIKLLIEHGLDINVRDYKGRTPLHSAALGIASYCSSTQNPSFTNLVVGVEDIQALITSGADVNALDSEGVTPLMLSSNDEELINLLVSKGADINVQDLSGRTILHRIVQSSFTPPKSNNGDATDPPSCGLGLDPIKKLEFLLSKGAKPNIRDSDGLTVLGTLAKIEEGKGLVNAARVLLAHHADVDAFDKDGNTMLHLAAAAGNSELVEFLLKEQEFNPIRKNFRDETALHVVMDTKTAAILLKYKGNPQLQDKQGETPLYKAVSRGKVELVKLLLDARSDTYLSNINGETLLHIAARLGNVPIMEMLLKAGMKVDRDNPARRTPLHEAARSLSPTALEAIKFLLANGASVNLRDKTNSTPLHEVVSKEPTATMLEEVKLLLAHGADPNLKNEEGQTPLEIAKRERQWRPNLYSSSASQAENDKVLANVKRLDDVIAVLEKIPFTPAPERRIFGEVKMADGSPVNATIAVGDDDAPATKIWTEAKDGKFEFRLTEGHHFHMLVYYDTEKDGVPVRFYQTILTQTVNGDRGPLVITLDHFVRRQ